MIPVNLKHSETEPLKSIKPIAFISSFTTESGITDEQESPLRRLRRNIYNLKDAPEFAEVYKTNSDRVIAWVAEHTEPELGLGIKSVDRLVEVLAQSDLYICILADARRGEKEYGTQIEVSNIVSATSYFEIELYAAAMYGKIPHLFILDGFSPGPRLQSLLDILSFAIPDWRNRKSLPEQDIVNQVRQLIADHLCKPKTPIIPLRKRLVREFYFARAKKAPPGHEIDNVHFLDGQFRTGMLPQKDLVEELLADFERVPEMQRKLCRMWLAVRELMSASYFPKEVAANSKLADFLPLWDKVLGYWGSAAAWSGWHGHIFAGTVASINSQEIIRSQLLGVEPLNGSLASAYYSIANLMPLGYQRFECLNRAAKYIEKAISISGGINPGELAVRGSIRLRFGNVWGAVSDFKEMLRLREHRGESEESLADAKVHLGFAYLFCANLLKGRDYLEQGVKAMSKNPNNPGVARAKRKLALAYQLTGKFAQAKMLRQEAQADAIRLGAFDQANR